MSSKLDQFVDFFDYSLIESRIMLISDHDCTIYGMSVKLEKKLKWTVRYGRCQKSIDHCTIQRARRRDELFKFLRNIWKFTTYPRKSSKGFYVSESGDSLLSTSSCNQVGDGVTWTWFSTADGGIKRILLTEKNMRVWIHGC